MKAGSTVVVVVSVVCSRVGVLCIDEVTGDTVICSWVGVVCIDVVTVSWYCFVLSVAIVLVSADVLLNSVGSKFLEVVSAVSSC